MAANSSALPTNESYGCRRPEQYFSNQDCGSNNSELCLYMQTRQGLQTGILASYLVTMTIGLLGNSLVIYVIAAHAHIRQKSVANYYIWNLAFADLFFVLTMPLFCYATYCNEWPFGTVMCKMATVFCETNRYASMFTLVALSVDRYLASYCNIGHLRTVRTGIMVCCVIWILCGTISIPYWMYSTVRCNQCTTDFSTSFMRFWTYFQLALGLVIPLIVICISYILLALRLKRMLHRSSTRSSIQTPSRKMLRTVLVVVIIFLVCQVPWHVNDIVRLRVHVKHKGSRSGLTVTEMTVSMYLQTISIILVFISSCCNPIIYGILNDNYRQEYIAVLCCCCYKPVVSAATTHTTTRRTSMGTNIQMPLAYGFQARFLSSCCGPSTQTTLAARQRMLAVASHDSEDHATARTDHIGLDED